MLPDEIPQDHRADTREKGKKGTGFGRLWKKTLQFFPAAQVAIKTRKSKIQKYIKIAIFKEIIGI